MNETLVTENLRLVHMCANRFRDRGIEYEELYSAGCLGLVKAAGNFDASLGFAFSTYAVPVIFGEIKRCFRDGGEIKVSRSMKEKARELMRVKDAMEAERGESVSVNDLAEALSVSPGEVGELLGVSMPAISIDSGGTEDGEIEIPEKSFESECLTKITVSEILSKLTENDRRLIELRYFEEKTQTEIGTILGMSQVQVSRREKVLLGVMRELLCA